MVGGLSFVILLGNASPPIIPLLVNKGFGFE